MLPLLVLDGNGPATRVVRALTFRLPRRLDYTILICKVNYFTENARRPLPILEL